MSDDRDKSIRELADAQWTNPNVREIEQGPLGSDAFFEGLVLDAFVRGYSGHWRYVTQWGHWLVFNGKYWRRDDTQLLKFLLTRLCARIATKHKRRLPGTRVSTIENLAQALREVARTGDIFDSDPWLLNTETATIDLRTMGDHGHDRDDNLTKIAGAAAVGGNCPEWKRFLDRVTGGDAELQTYLQRVAGYCLTGSTRDHVFFFAYGSGGNGKSTFVNVLSAVMGDYARAVPAETFMQTKLDRHPTELAGMRGYRLVIAVEVPRGARWHETRIKTLTGGDRVSARFLYQDYFEYTPVFKLLIVGNNKPSLRSVDEAMRRRLHMLPFTVTIAKEERDPKLLDKLMAERHAILNWMLEGCADWQREGLNPPQRVRAATDDYFASQDTMGRWLAERCEVGKPFEEPTGELFDDWKSWAESNGEFVGSKRAFGERLDELGFIPVKGTKGVRKYRGLRLAGAPSEPLE